MEGMIMDNRDQIKGYSFFISIVIWGTIWGIFEATVGYLLHLLPFRIGWLVWYPVACFFMSNAYRRTNRVSSVLFVGILCASIKMLNLLFPVSIDRVINPAVSIVLEALAMALVIFVLNRTYNGKAKSPFAKLLAAFSMNTAWRTLYILYLLFLVPDWMREISVIGSAEKFVPFFVTQNLITSFLLFGGYQFKHIIFRPVEAAERKIASVCKSIPSRAMPALKISIVLLLLCADAALELLL